MVREVKSYDEAMAMMEAARLPVGPVYTPQEAIDDSHVKALRQLVPLDFPGLARPAPVSATPFTMSETPGMIVSRAPLLGEHNHEILGDLGYSHKEIVALADNAII
jgi:crotonobetainyl-CoA:carnitine CoA-transferase CaiB-like acyl-CoA transferase